ncbi:putative taste receptor type 2 member 33 [Ascaphus truei]|uniref:putative taste receptor type 2 member 33 n=1 Tax=Ascaphus truei TaxID=8439 RepID=UPI003F5AC2F1
MPSVFTWALTAAQTVAFLVGVATNGFVLGVNLCDRISGSHITSSDQFMCSMAVSNLSLQFWTVANWICDHFKETGYSCQAIYAFKMVSSHCSLLLTASLCIFYCSRIVVFHHSLLLQLQTHIKSSYHYLIVWSFLICLVMGLPLAWTDERRESVLSTNFSLPGNSSTKNLSYMDTYRSLLVPFGYAMPLLCVLVSAGLIMRSLMKHMKRMRITMKTGHEVRMEVHLRAGSTVLSLLILFIAYFVSSILIVIDLFPDEDPRRAICYLASTLYSPVHSIVLIRGNTKLRGVAAGIARKLRRVKG